MMVMIIASATVMFSTGCSNAAGGGGGIGPAITLNNAEQTIVGSYESDSVKLVFNADKTGSYTDGSANIRAVYQAFTWSATGEYPIAKITVKFNNDTNAILDFSDEGEDATISGDIGGNSVNVKLKIENEDIIGTWKLTSPTNIDVVLRGNEGPGYYIIANVFLTKVTFEANGKGRADVRVYSSFIKEITGTQTMFGITGTFEGNGFASGKDIEGAWELKGSVIYVGTVGELELGAAGGIKIRGKKAYVLYGDKDPIILEYTKQ